MKAMGCDLMECLEGIRNPCKLLKRWSGRPDSNRRRPAWEAGILPLNYSRSPIRSKYRRFIGFTATANLARLRIQILPTGSHGLCFQSSSAVSVMVTAKLDSKESLVPPPGHRSKVETGSDWPVVLTRCAGIRLLAVFRHAFLMVLGRLDGLSFGEVFRYCCSA